MTTLYTDALFWWAGAVVVLGCGMVGALWIVGRLLDCCINIYWRRMEPTRKLAVTLIWRRDAVERRRREGMTSEQIENARLREQQEESRRYPDD